MERLRDFLSKKAGLKRLPGVYCKQSVFYLMLAGLVAVVGGSVTCYLARPLMGRYFADFTSIRLRTQSTTYLFGSNQSQTVKNV